MTSDVRSSRFAHWIRQRKPLPRPLRFLRAVLLTLAALAGLSGASWLGWMYWNYHRAQPPDESRTLYPGITYRRVSRRLPRPMVLQVVRIDLRTPGLRFRVTPGDASAKLPLQARTPSAYLRDSGAQLAINGDFFYPWWSHSVFSYYPHIGDPITVEGHACSEGTCYVTDAARAHFPCLYLSRDNHATIGTQPPKGEMLYNVVSGIAVILRDGKPIEPYHDLQPRTAVGIDQTGRYLTLLLVDGRQPNYSEGATLLELAGLLREFGAWSGLNLDGGGSTTLAIRDPREGGSIHVLNSPIDCHIPGRERPIANHFAIFAPSASDKMVGLLFRK